MKTSTFTEEQIVQILREAEMGEHVKRQLEEVPDVN